MMALSGEAIKEVMLAEIVIADAQDKGAQSDNNSSESEEELEPRTVMQAHLSSHAAYEIDQMDMEDF